MKLRIIGGIGSIILLLCIGTLTSCESDEQIEFNRYYSLGSSVYQSRCQNCHGAKGEGLQALIPPLNDQDFFKMHTDQLSCLIQNGMKGKITVNNKLFEGEMPAADLPSIQIAGVLTYITNSFGNKAGTVKIEAVENSLKTCN